MKKTITLILVLAVFAGIAIALKTVRTPVSVNDPLPGTGQSVAPIERQVSYICADDRTFTVDFADNDAIATVNLGDVSYTLERSGSGVRYANDGDQIVLSATNEGAFIEEDGEMIYGGCVVTENPGGQLYDPALEYVSSEYRMSFSYPERYLLRDRNAGTTERPQLSVVLVEDTQENRDLLDGKVTEPREGPISITVDVYQNPDELGAYAWAEQDTNWNISSKQTTVVEVGGDVGVSYNWDGLYAGKSAVVTRGDLAYVFSVTWMTQDDIILTDYDALLDSVVFAE